MIMIILCPENSLDLQSIAITLFEWNFGLPTASLERSFNDEEKNGRKNEADLCLGGRRGGREEDLRLNPMAIYLKIMAIYPKIYPKRTTDRPYGVTSDKYPIYIHDNPQVSTKPDKIPDKLAYIYPKWAQNEGNLSGDKWP